MMRSEEKIPRIIHWCWLSGEPVPPFLRACMATWKRHLPDYTIKCWTQENFDIHSVRWVEEAVAARKWAFAADYIRLYALHTEGGIYLDSDVEILKPFDRLLRHDFFSCPEYNPVPYKRREVPVDKAGRPLDPEAFIEGYGLQAAVMGAARGNSYVAECLEFYRERPFREPDGRLRTDLIMPLVMVKIAERHGFRYVDKVQRLRDFAGKEIYLGRNSLLPSFIYLLRLRSMAFHHCAGSWVDGAGTCTRTIGKRRIPLILKFAAKMRWWQFRKWRKRLSGGNDAKP